MAKAFGGIGVALGKQMRGVLPEVGKITAQVCALGIILL